MNQKRAISMIGMVIVMSNIWFSGCQSGSSNLNPAPESAPAFFPTKQAALSFGIEQNDSAGYNGMTWGTNINEFSVSKGYHNQEEVINKFCDHALNATAFAKLLNVPHYTVSGMGATISNVDWTLVPTQFQDIYIKADDTHYVFFRGALTLMFKNLHATAYEAVRSELGAKYSQPQTISARWEHEDPSANEPTEMQALLYKRGETNTRIYLVMLTSYVHSMNMKYTSVFIAYMPNSYYEAIRSEIGTNKSAQEGAKAAEENQTIQKDQSAVE